MTPKDPFWRGLFGQILAADSLPGAFVHSRVCVCVCMCVCVCVCVCLSFVFSCLADCGPHGALQPQETQRGLCWVRAASGPFFGEHFIST